MSSRRVQPGIQQASLIRPIGSSRLGSPKLDLGDGVPGIAAGFSSLWANSEETGTALALRMAPVLEAPFDQLGSCRRAS